MKTLEVKNIVPFAPYGLKGENKSTKEKYYLHGIDVVQKMVYVYDGGVIPGWLNINLFIPYLYPLSWLTKEIEHNGEKFVPIVKIADLYLSPRKHSQNEDVAMSKYGSLRYEISSNRFLEQESGECITPIHIYEMYQKLFEWKFDMFGLIEQGLAIDKSTIK